MPLTARLNFASRFFWVTMAFVLSALWGGIAYLHSDGEARELEAADHDVLNLSLAFAEHTKASFQRVDALLLELRKGWIHGKEDFTSEVTLLQAAASDLAFQVAVIGPDGRLDYSNLAVASERIDLSDREHFRAVRDDAGRGIDRLFNSKPLKGRVSGRWSIQFARPMLATGEFAGVLVVSIDPGYFARFYEAVNLGEGSVVSMVRASGDVLTRAPDMEFALGQQLTGTPYLADGAPERGVFSRTAQLDGKLRIYGYHRLPAYGVILVVGLEKAAALADMVRRQRLELIAGLLVTALLLAMMLVVARAQATERRWRGSLARSESRLRRVQEVMPTGIVVLDRQGEIIECNPAAERILGVSREKLLSRSIALGDWHAVRPDERLLRPDEFPGSIVLREGRAVLDVEMGLRPADGAMLWLSVSALPTGEEERPVLVVFSDITDRKRDQQKIADSEKRFRALFDAFTEIVFVVDTSGRFAMVHVPRALEAHSAAMSWVGRNFGEVLPPAAAAELSATLAGVMADGAPRTSDVSLELAGSERHYRVSVSLLQADASWPEGFVMVLHDVTSERAVAEAQRVAATTFESQEGMMITDAKGIILRVNRAFTDLTGYVAEEVVGRSPSILKSGRQGAEFYRQMWSSLAGTGYWQGEVWNRRKGGEVYPEWLTISAVCDDEGRTTHYVGAFSDITERKEAEERIRHLAFYDPLSTLPNRRLLLDRLHQALAAGQRSLSCGALLYLDLDHFKLLNDTRGHDAGDELLVMMAERLKASVREQDTVARLGGDEFVVMLENLDADESVAAHLAGSVAEKIRAALERPFQLAGGDYVLTPSIGVSLFRGREHDAQTLMKQADLALYEAKDQGRNTVRFFNHVMQEEVSAQAAILSGLRRALDRNEFVLYLQPQFSAAGQRTGAEVLLRWRNGGELIAPGRFIPHAETSGLIVPIGEWVLDRSCAILAQWATSRPGETLSVNVSARQFHQPEFVAVVASALSRHGVDGAQLCLELTETAVLGDVDFAARTMAGLKALGVRISLDDFGTGFSSLSNLRRLPISEVKIDRSFVQEIARNEQDASIVRAIISMCQNLDMRVVAEGVETEVQRDFLVACRCDILQGYLLARPGPYHLVG